MQLSDSDWKQKLSKEQYAVLRQKNTEAPFTGAFLYHKDKGTYICAGCGEAVFSSSDKFDSGCGWPSFSDVTSSSSVRLIEDNSHGMRRLEVVCGSCGGHLGHRFPDAPDQPTGLRYCINSVSIDFKPLNQQS